MCEWNQNMPVKDIESGPSNFSLSHFECFEIVLPDSEEVKYMYYYYRSNFQQNFKIQTL